MIDSEETDEEDVSILWFQQGVPEAFKVFFFQYYPELFSFSVLLVHDCLAAQKVSMDAFFHCWERRTQFTSDKMIKAFLYLAVRNNCMDYLRERANPDATQPPNLESTPPSSLPDYIVKDIYAYAAVGLRESGAR